ncbi:MAG: hypothetical protein ABIH39_05610 [Candidatus Margulisiibacteriota bacterium]
MSNSANNKLIIIDIKNVDEFTSTSRFISNIWKQNLGFEPLLNPNAKTSCWDIWNTKNRLTYLSESIEKISWQEIKALLD